jgi:hypothetical protein
VGVDHRQDPDRAAVEAMALASEAMIWPGPGLDEDDLPIRMAAVQKRVMPVGAGAVFAAAADAMCAWGVWVPAAWMRNGGPEPGAV